MFHRSCLQKVLNSLINDSAPQSQLLEQIESLLSGYNIKSLKNRPHVLSPSIFNSWHSLSFNSLVLFSATVMNKTSTLHVPQFKFARFDWI